MLAETAETNILQFFTLTDWTLIKRDFIFAIQSKIYCFLSNGTGHTRFNPIIMQQTQPKDNIFSTQVNMVQASDLEMRAETRNFSLKKVSDAQLFGARKNILPYEWTICMKYNQRYNFFDKVRQDKHLAIDLPTRAKTQNFELFLEVKTN